MNRYINADKLLDSYHDIALSVSLDNGHSCMGVSCMQCPFLNCEDNKCELESVILQQPMVDADPVKHGRWKTNNAYPKMKFCSECGMPFAKRQYEVWNFCPECGARMDEVEDD